MKKVNALLIVLFLVYASLMSLYFLKGNLFPGPGAYAGTAADPHTFMTQAEIDKAQSLSRIHALAFFVESPLHMGLLLLLLGVSVRFRSWVERWFRRSFFRLAAYVFLFLLLTYVLFLPLDYAMLRIDHAFGLSNTTVGTWLSDHGKDLLIEWLSTVIVLAVFYWLERRSPRRWWFWLWLASIPMILFVQFIQPVVLDPLYNDYQPLQNQALKKEILALAAKADIPAQQVYQVNMSERTNAINAYVNGIGGNARIVLWDTILNKLKKDEILVVMAHEMGHYKEKHIYWGTAFGIALSLGVLWIAYHLFRGFVGRWGRIWGIRDVRDLAALPVLLLIVSLLNVVLTPAQNTFSRYIEHRADMYAMKMTGDGDAGIRAFQRIAKENLSPVTQPPLVYWFLGTHPTIQDRILYFEQFRKK